MLLLVASVVAARAWGPMAPVEPTPSAQPEATAGVLALARMSADSLDAAVQRLVASDPFRMSGAVGSERVTPSSVTPAGVPALLAHGAVGASPVVGLALNALAGPPWTAVVAGLPGQPAQSVLMVGDSAGGFRVTAIRRDTVILQSRDSTVRLTLPKEMR